ncbi:MAG: DUF11 domain-containing protein, partial [Sphingobacteriales bacterium]
IVSPGGQVPTNGVNVNFSAELNLVPTGTQSLTRLSGTNEFTVTGNNITNSGSGAGATPGFASGTVMVRGENITTIVFRSYIYVPTDAPQALGANNTDSWGIAVSAPIADLAITKTTSTTTPVIGSTMTYTLRASNSGPGPATNVVVTDSLKNGLTYLNASPSKGTYNPATGLWAVGSLAVNEEATLTMNVTVKDVGNMTNKAFIAGAESDPVSTNNAEVVNVNPISDPNCTTTLLPSPASGFDNPTGITNTNNNNIQPGATYDGWSTVAGSAGLFNIIKVGGSAYAPGPDLAHNGTQYVDIANAAGTITRPITLAKASTLSYSGWFSNRTGNNYQPWIGSVDIRNQDQSVIAGVAGTTSTTVSFTNTTDLESWFFVSGKTGIVPAGTYLYRANLGNDGHFDDAFVCAHEVPTVDLTQSSATVVENVGNATYTVRLNGTAGTVLETSVTVNVAAAPGTAAATSDYGTPSVTLVTFAAGTIVGSPAASQNFTIPIVNDAISEETESFGVNISGLTGTALLGTSAVTTTINDNDVVATITNTTNGNETGPIQGVFTVNLSNLSPNATTLTYALSGSATEGSDYADITIK